MLYVRVCRGVLFRPVRLDVLLCAGLDTIKLGLVRVRIIVIGVDIFGVLHDVAADRYYLTGNIDTVTGDIGSAAATASASGAQWPYRVLRPARDTIAVVHFHAVYLGIVDNHDGTSVVVDSYALGRQCFGEVAVDRSMVISVGQEHLEPAADIVDAVDVLVRVAGIQ